MSAPSWKDLFSTLLQKNLDAGYKDALNFSFATLPGPGSIYPRVRTCVFRGFAFEPHGENTGAKGSSLLTFTTDSTMKKAEELLGRNEKGELNNTFEACFWFADSGDQFRFAGRAWVLGPKSFPQQNVFNEQAERLLKTYTHGISGNVEEAWQAERQRIWEGQKPMMRRTFCSPHPGSPMTNEKSEQLHAMPMLPVKPEDAKGKVTKKDDDGKEAEEYTGTREDVEEALKRFCIVVLEIDEVDRVLLSPPPGGRWRWKKVGSNEWDEQEVCP
ncbi:hypothetical protein YB2330_000716 [Saitoella coloradoensis]